MKFFLAVFIALISVGVCFIESNLEATDGENVTIHLEIAELDKADRVTITHTREGQKTRIAQYCRCAHCQDCNAVEAPGVLLQVKERKLILLDVSSRNSGLYEATIIVGNNVSKKNATLKVNKPPFSSSTEPPQTSSSKPLNSSEHQWLYVIIVPVVLIIGVLGLCFFCKCMKEGDPAAIAEPVLLNPCFLQACREDTGDLGKIVDLETLA